MSTSPIPVLSQNTVTVTMGDPILVEISPVATATIPADLTVDSITFNEAGVAVGPRQLAWNDTDGTLDLGMNNGGVVQQIGLETFYRVRNNTGTAIANGAVVRISGAIGNSGRVTVALAQANGANASSSVIGLATEDIPDGEDGFVTHFGIVRGINTTGGAENWQDGDELYLSATTAGALTNIEPSAPLQKILIGTVVNAAVNGQVMVRVRYSGKLNDIDDVDTTGASAGEALVYDGAEWVAEGVVATDTSGSIDITAVWGGTQAEYNLIVTPSATTLYVIVG
jgi:hypothetical protein